MNLPQPITILLLFTACCYASARGSPALDNFRVLDGVVYDITAPGTKWRTLQGEAVAIKPNGTLVRTFTMQAVYAVPSKTVVSHLNGRADPKATGQSKVYGKTVFVLGNTKLILKQELRAAAMLAGQATIDGVLVEVWKEGTRATQAQVRQFQVHQTK